MEALEDFEMYDEAKLFLKNYECQLMDKDDTYFRSEIWKKEGYLCHGKRSRKIVTIHGVLYINRYYYYNRKTKKGYFYLDSYNGWNQRQRISNDVKQIIVKSYGIIPVVEIVEQFGISKITVFNILKEFGVVTNNHRGVKK